MLPLSTAPAVRQFNIILPGKVKFPELGIPLASTIFKIDQFADEQGSMAMSSV
jgi:hypothetical protein